MNDNLEKRVRNLEMLHYWALTAISVVIVAYVIQKEKK